MAAAILVTVAGACGKLQIDGSNTEREMLRAVLNGRSPDYATKDSQGVKLWKQTQTFYSHRNFQAAWVEKAKPDPRSKR